MKIDLEKLLGSTRYNLRRNHLISNCPFCGKDGHFYLNIEKIFKKKDDGAYKNAFDCKRCLEKGNLVKLLKQLDKEHLLDGEQIDLNKKLDKKLIVKTIEPELDLSVPDKKLPVGFKRIYKDDYLSSRGFTKKQFERYIIGETKTLFKYQGYIIVSVEEENNCKGYLGRSRLSRVEIDEINQQYREGGSKQKYLRYRNSDNTDFSKLILGYDEIDFLTKTMILTEGFFDKVSVDKVIDGELTMKCGCTFGKNISEYQIQKLKNKGIENVILIQDPDAVNDSKKIAFRLNSEFNVLVGFTGSKDLGDSTTKEIINVLNNLKTPEQYFIETVLKKKLA